MRPIINFTEKKGGAYNSSPEGKTSVNTLTPKTLSVGTYCGRNENLECYSSTRPKAIPARYYWSGSKSDNDFINEEYAKVCSKVLLPSDAKELLDYFRWTFVKDARRLMYVNGEPEPIFVRQLLQKAETEAIELNYKLSDGTYISESYVLIFETEQQFNKFVEDYKSDPLLNIKIVAITNPKRWRVLVILPEIYPSGIAANKMYNMAKAYNCSYDNRLFIGREDKTTYPEKYKQFPTDGRLLGFNLWGGAKA